MLRTLNHKALTQVLACLHQDGVIALPTETVYGLAADAQNPTAINRLFAIKGRPHSRPISILMASMQDMETYAKDIPKAAWQLAEAFWPGPMTLILPKKSEVSDILSANTPTIGLRVPDHAMAQQVLKAFGRGLAAPSANTHKALSPTSAAAVRADLGDKVDHILDGGIASAGIESTIIDCTKQSLTVLREGFLDPQTMSDTIGTHIQISKPATAQKPATMSMHSLSLDEIANRLQNHSGDATMVVISRHKPTHRQVILHDSRVPERENQTPKTSAIHWILMPQDPYFFAQCFYQKLSLASRLMQGNPNATCLFETLPQDHFIWRSLTRRLTKRTG